MMFPKDKLDVIMPTIIGGKLMGNQYFRQMADLGKLQTGRYTDLPDEVQVKDKVPLDLMCGLTIPMHNIRIPFYNLEMTTKAVIKDLNKIKQLLVTYGYDVPLYDIDTALEIKDEADIKKLVKHYFKKI